MLTRHFLGFRNAATRQSTMFLASGFETVHMTSTVRAHRGILLRAKNMTVWWGPGFCLLFLINQTLIPLHARLPQLSMNKYKYADDEASIALSTATPASTTSDGNLPDDAKSVEEIAENERKIIAWTKGLLMVALVAAVFILSYGTYRYVQTQEDNTFRSEVSAGRGAHSY